MQRDGREVYRHMGRHDAHRRRASLHQVRVERHGRRVSQGGLEREGVVDRGGHLFGRFVILAKGVWQARVGVRTYSKRRFLI